MASKAKGRLASLASSGMSYKKVMGSVAIQIGCEAGEFSAAIVSAALDTVAANTETKADDLALPWVKKGISTAMRVGAGRWVAGQHPGVAAIMSATASALSGCEYKGWLQRHGVVAVRRAAESLQTGGSTR